MLGTITPVPLEQSSTGAFHGDVLIPAALGASAVSWGGSFQHHFWCLRGLCSKGCAGGSSRDQAASWLLAHHRDMGTQHSAGVAIHGDRGSLPWGQGACNENRPMVWCPVSLTMPVACPGVPPWFRGAGMLLRMLVG